MVADTLRAMVRGARRRCPRCGEGALFERWFSMHERCPSCDLTFEATSGDTWGFWVMMDRLFLLAAMVLATTPLPLPWWSGPVPDPEKPFGGLTSLSNFLTHQVAFVATNKTGENKLNLFLETLCNSFYPA